MTDATDPIDAADDASDEADASEAADADATDDAESDDAADADAAHDEAACADADAADDTCAAEDADTEAQREFKKNARDAIRKFLKSMSKRRGGADFYSLLLLLFIGLKLTGHIDWSWVWVLSPFWIRALFRLAVIALMVTLMKKFGWKPSGKT